jgi:hypothetical protein
MGGLAVTHNTADLQAPAGWRRAVVWVVKLQYWGHSVGILRGARGAYYAPVDDLRLMNCGLRNRNLTQRMGHMKQLNSSQRASGYQRRVEG